MNSSRLLSLIVLLGLPVAAHAGAWVREKNEVYSKIAWTRFESDQVYEHSKNRKRAGPDFESRTVSFYAEYGFTPKWTGITSLDYKSQTSKSTGTASADSGAADAWFHAKRAFLTAPFILSGQVGAKIPLGYDERHVPPLGDGQIDLEARLLAGKSFQLGAPGYGNAEIAYRKRNGDFSDEIPYRLEAGVFPLKRILLKLALDGITNLSNDRASDIGATRTANVFDQEYMKLSPGLIFFLNSGFSIDVYYETTLSGANASAGRSLGIGVAWQGKI